MILFGFVSMGRLFGLCAASTCMPVAILIRGPRIAEVVLRDAFLAAVITVVIIIVAIGALAHFIAANIAEMVLILCINMRSFLALCAAGAFMPVAILIRGPLSTKRVIADIFCAAGITIVVLVFAICMIEVKV